MGLKRCDFPGQALFPADATLDPRSGGSSTGFGMKVEGYEGLNQTVSQRSQSRLTTGKVIDDGYASVRKTISTGGSACATGLGQIVRPILK